MFDGIFNQRLQDQTWYLHLLGLLFYIEFNFQAVLETLPVGVVLTDPEGRTRWVNSGFSEMCGYGLGELKGRTPGSVLQGPATDQETVARMGRALSEGRPFSERVLNYHRSQRHYWAELDVTPLDPVAGVEGYMLKRSTPEEFETAIKRVSAGGNYFSDEIVRTVASKLNKIREESLARTSKPEFTERETEILKLLCEGLNNDQISDIIHISPKTIEKHKSNLFQKTDTNNTINLILYAIRNDLVQLEK